MIDPGLKREIVDYLRAVARPLSAGEIAFFLHEETPDVRTALTDLISDRKVQRHHIEDGTLRYSPRDAVDRQRERPQQPRTANDSSRDITVSLDIQVDSAIRELDAIAQCPNPAARLKVLHEIDSVLHRHLERCALEVLVAENSMEQIHDPRD